ncbi:MAG: hypothetical protein ACRBB6_02400 [Neptuniibacter sp.]
MRVGVLILLFLMGGCASKTPQITEPLPKPVEKVEPVALDIHDSDVADIYEGFLQPLISNVGQELFYQSVSGKRLYWGYTYSHKISDTDPKKNIFAFKSKDEARWGYLTAGSGNNAIANAFLIQNQQVGLAYALVLKRIKICLVTEASGLPEWHYNRWIYPEKPGYFECTGMTNKSLFRVGTGLPAILGPYYEEKDTILIFRQFSELQQIVQALKQQFPHLKIPIVPLR